MDFAVPPDHRVKLRESEKKDEYLDLTKELKKTIEHESDDYTSCGWCSLYSHQEIGIGTKGLRDKRMSGDHPNYSVVEIVQNTEKSPGDLRRLGVTQSPVESYQLTLVWKKIVNESNDHDTLVNHRVNIKERENGDKYLDLVRERK